jgi:hypothetical protein
MDLASAVTYAAETRLSFKWKKMLFHFPSIRMFLKGFDGQYLIPYSTNS